MKLFSLFVFVAMFTASFSNAAVPTVFVKKNDGSKVQYKLLPVKHDPRHAEVVERRLSLASKSLFHKQYDIPSSVLPAIRDQGNRGTCAYFATVGLLETYYMTQPSTACCLKISEECLVGLRNWEYETDSYTGADKPDVRPDPNGDLPNSIALTIQHYGVPEAGHFGVSEEQVDCVYDGNNEKGQSISLSLYEIATKSSKPYGQGLKFDLNNGPTIDSIKELIALNVPVEVGVLVYWEYLDGRSDWRFNPKIDNEDNLAGAHAIQLVGFETKLGKTVFKFKNSWGKSWGEEGYGTIDEALLKKSWGYDPAFDFTTSIH